jgi:hypothetical protein
MRLKLSLVLLSASLATGISCIGDIDSTSGEPDDSVSGDKAGIIEALAPGDYKLVRQGSQKCLDINENSNSNGAKVQQWVCNGTTAQAFTMEHQGNEIYRLKKTGTNKCVEIASGSGNGTLARLWTCGSSSAQKFKMEPKANGTHRLRSQSSSKCLDVNGGSSADGATVQIWSCNSSDAQLWKVTPASAGPDPGDPGDDDWHIANLTNYTSWPEPGSEECEDFSGCQWAGYFAFVDGQKSEEWVAAHNIIAVHSKDADTYALKTLRLRQGNHQIDATVYDMCSDNDCDGCCTQNSPSGFLIDIESYTMDRFGSGDGIVEWKCLDCN